MNPIKFGTDGWRALIDIDFTEDNIKQVIQAFCDWRTKIEPSKKQIVLGFDRRLKSPETANLVAQVLCANGFFVKLSTQFCPTPCVSWMVKNTEAFAGVMITASHNPWQWNGIKFKEEYGGSASPEYTQEVESQLMFNQKNGVSPKTISLEEAKSKGYLSFFDPHVEYLTQLKNLVNLNIIRDSKIKILIDPLFGAGSGFFKKLLPDQVDEIHANADTTFGGINPEPIDKNLGELMQKMSTGGWQAGLATDGDADRIGAVDESGHYVNSHQIFALLLKHYVEDKKLKGTVIKSVSTTQMIPLLCKKYGLECVETPIGFKHICLELTKRDSLMGGEESGGLSYAPHVHERDGVLNGLMLLEMMAERKKTLSQLITELYQEIGTFYFDRLDLHVEQTQIATYTERLLKNPLTKICSRAISSTNFIDGFKYIFADASWLLIRASGTEPLVRVYAEAKDPALIKSLLAEGEYIIRGLIPELHP